MVNITLGIAFQSASRDEISNSPALTLTLPRRTLSEDHRKSYIQAVHCLLEKPPLTSKKILPGVTNRFEDFLGDHILQTNTNHFVGHFYPWHRLLIWSYEQEIRNCGFDGAQPYWDWALDANSLDDLLSSPIWDPTTGFGGNGAYVSGSIENPEPGIPVTAKNLPFSMDDRSGGGCLPNGPFSNMSFHMGPGYSTAYNPQCVRRDFVPSIFLPFAHPDSVARGMAQPDFGSFSQLTESTMHGAGHPGIGGLYGTLTDVWASPGDPLFFLHHANLDRAWWSWQNRNLTARLHDISGPLFPNDYANAQGRNVTLNDKVHVGSTVNVTLPIKEIMDIHNDLLCYTYDSLY
ncbi:tyrosinase central domain protein [Stagonosporopsis vannaccii]|nr:tyrosinase central domain protein [Stagonosporopsis vannaccii]